MSVAAAFMSRLTRFLRQFSPVKLEAMDPAFLDRWNTTCRPRLRLFETSGIRCSEKKFTMDPSKLITKKGTVVRKPTPRKVYIRLMFDNQESVMTLAEANNIARARGLTLLPVDNKSKQSMPEYEMVRDIQLVDKSTPGESKLNESSRKKMEKRVKTYVFNANIEKNDLSFMLKNLSSSLMKRGKVKCMIKGMPNCSGSIDKLYDEIRVTVQKLAGPISCSILRDKSNIKSFEMALINETTI